MRVLACRSRGQGLYPIEPGWNRERSIGRAITHLAGGVGGPAARTEREMMSTECSNEVSTEREDAPNRPARGIGTSAGRGAAEVPMIGTGDSSGLAAVV